MRTGLGLGPAPELPALEGISPPKASVSNSAKWGAAIPAWNGGTLRSWLGNSFMKRAVVTPHLSCLPCSPFSTCSQRHLRKTQSDLVAPSCRPANDSISERSSNPALGPWVAPDVLSPRSLYCSCPGLLVLLYNAQLHLASGFCASLPLCLNSC